MGEETGARMMEIRISAQPEELCIAPGDEAAVRRAVETVGRLYGAEGAEVSVTLTNDAYIHEINRQYRGVDRSTDVISFALMESEEPEILDDPAGDVLGDLVISLERARAQAEEYGHSYLRELSFLTVHGMLHLLGYDHMEDAERAEMEEEQRHVMEALGIGR